MEISLSGGGSGVRVAGWGCRDLAEAWGGGGTKTPAGGGGRPFRRAESNQKPWIWGGGSPRIVLGCGIGTGGLGIMGSVKAMGQWNSEEPRKLLEVKGGGF